MRVEKSMLHPPSRSIERNVDHLDADGLFARQRQELPLVDDRIGMRDEAPSLDDPVSRCASGALSRSGMRFIRLRSRRLAEIEIVFELERGFGSVKQLCHLSGNGWRKPTDFVAEGLGDPLHQSLHLPLHGLAAAVADAPKDEICISDAKVGIMRSRRVKGCRRKACYYLLRGASIRGVRSMDEANFADQLLHYSRLTANLEMQRLKIELSRYWSDEIAKPRHADPLRLLRYGFKTYSQNDEDGIIQEIFNRIGVTNRHFVEFGVENGLECSTAK